MARRTGFPGAGLLFPALWLLGAAGASAQGRASVWETYEGSYAEAERSEGVPEGAPAPYPKSRA